jgi:hypothetical protein
LKANHSPQTAVPHSVTFREATAVWLKVAIYSFGGPAGQIAVMHRILVDEKRWVSENRFLHALNYCMLLPGPEAQQLATYIGWLLHRTRGGLVAGGLFVLPGFLSILALRRLSECGAGAGDFLRVETGRHGRGRRGGTAHWPTGFEKQSHDRAGGAGLYRHFLL